MALCGKFQTEENVHDFAEMNLNHAVLVLAIRVVDEDTD